MSDTRVEALENEILDLRRRLAAAEASPPPEERKGFEYELQALLNSHCKENDSNTPDFILANYITRCLETFTVTTRERERWYGVRLAPGTSEYELQALLNNHSKENDSNTPDFILANFITRCLEAFTVTTRERERWYGVRLVHSPGKIEKIPEVGCEKCNWTGLDYPQKVTGVQVNDGTPCRHCGLKDVVQLIEATNPGEHVSVMHGDEQRTGVVDRWSWSCRCGSGSKRSDMTIDEARKDFREHTDAVGAPPGPDHSMAGHFAPAELDKVRKELEQVRREFREHLAACKSKPV